MIKDNKISEINGYSGKRFQEINCIDNNQISRTEALMNQRIQEINCVSISEILERKRKTMTMTMTEKEIKLRENDLEKIIKKITDKETLELLDWLSKIQKQIIMSENTNERKKM